MNNNSPELNQKDSDDKALVGVCLQYFIENNSYIKELKSEWFQQWANKGLLQSFSRVYLATDPETDSVVPWFMNRVFTDLALNKNSDVDTFKKYIDRLSKYDVNALERMHEINNKYGLEVGKDNFNQYFKNITDKNDQADFLLYFFSDAILHSEIIILSYYYEKWFGQVYKS